MENLAEVLYGYLRLMALNPEKVRKIDFIFASRFRRNQEHRLMSVLQRQGMLFVQLDIPVDNQDLVEAALQHLGVDLVHFEEINMDMLVFPMAMNIRGRVQDRDIRIFATTIATYINRVVDVTRKNLNKVEVYEFSRDRNRIDLLYRHNFARSEPVQPLTPERVMSRFGNDCSICLECLNPETKTTTLCNHNFCKPCIDRWRRFNSTCPNCRASLSPEVVRTARRETVAAEGAPDVSLDGLQIGDQERGQDGRIWMVQEYRGRTRWAPVRSLMENVGPRQLFR